MRDGCYESVKLVVGNGGCQVGRARRGSRRCGEHLPAVMVHSLSLWPLSSLKMQDGERKKGGGGGGVGWVRRCGGVVGERVGMAQPPPAPRPTPPHFHLLHSSYPPVDHAVLLLTSQAAPARGLRGRK